MRFEGCKSSAEHVSLRSILTFMPLTLTFSQIWVIATALTDILIAGTMSFIVELFLFDYAHAWLIGDSLQLYKSQENTTFKNTKRLVRGLILQCIETAAITAITMTLCLLCYEFMSWSSTYAVWYVHLMLCTLEEPEDKHGFDREYASCPLYVFSNVTL